MSVLRKNLSKANLYASRRRELRSTAEHHGVKTTTRSSKRDIVEALRASDSFRAARSNAARQLREARALIRDLDQEWGRSPNMLGALRGALSEAERHAPDEGTRRQMRAAEGMVGVHLFGDLDAWRARERLNAMRFPRDKRLLPKDHPARALFRKASRSLNAPKSKPQATRRIALYERLLESDNGPVARIGIAESERLRDFLRTGKYGRGVTPGRIDEERHRADSLYRAQVALRAAPPSGTALPGKRVAAKKPTATELGMSRVESAKAALARAGVTQFRVEPGGKGLQISFPYNGAQVSAVKQIPGAKYDPQTKSWSVSARQANALANFLEAQAALAASESPRTVDSPPRPVQMKTIAGNTYAVRDKLKALGGRWDGSAWRVPEPRYVEAMQLLQAQAARPRSVAHVPQSTPSGPARDRDLYPLDKLPPVGTPVRHGNKVKIVDGHGKTFRVNDSHSSIGFNRVIGREGDPAAFAYLRDATQDEVAAAERGWLRQRRKAQVADYKRTIVQQVDRAAPLGERPKLTALPEGDWIKPIDPQQSLYGYGTGLLVDRQGALWHVRRNGADGDNWGASNAPGAIATRLPAAPNVVRRIRRAFGKRKAGSPLTDRSLIRG